MQGETVNGYSRMVDALDAFVSEWNQLDGTEPTQPRPRPQQLTVPHSPAMQCHPTAAHAAHLPFT
jgi:hypothetical protein